VDGYLTTPPSDTQVSDQYVVPVAKSNQHKKRLACDNQPTGENIQPATKKIRHTPKKRNLGTTPIRRPKKTNSLPGNGHPSTSIHSRATSHHDKSLSTSVSKCKRNLNLDFTNQHQKSKNTSRSDSQDVTDTLSIHINQNISSGNDPDIAVHNIPNSEVAISSNSPSISATGNTTHDNGTPNCTMEPYHDRNSITYSSTYNDNFTTFILHKSNIQNTN
jgi:hypothetical protein